MSVEDTIKRFFLSEHLVGSGRTKIDLDESLISSGILDSMALLQLIVFIEEQFGVTVGDGELNPTNFETINQIKSFVEKKQQAIK